MRNAGCGWMEDNSVKYVMKDPAGGGMSLLLTTLVVRLSEESHHKALSLSRNFLTKLSESFECSTFHLD
jgi:hypothetical protein